jgi:2-oxoglutarate dehydrogenase complex dihydrolipoamide succinyltransferase (E2) component
MQVEIVMPKMGESIQEGTILHWAKKVGDKIQKDETLLEISTDKVDSEIPSPVSGVLVKVIANEQDTVPVGSVIAIVETDSSSVVKSVSDNKTQIANVDVKELNAENIETKIILDRIPQIKEDRFYSPLVRKIIQQESISADELKLINGSGSNGRVTKQDILRYLEIRAKHSHISTSDKNQWKIRQADISSLSLKYPSPKYRILRMENTQRKMAEHMLKSVGTSPHVTVVDEVDLSEIVNFRFRILKKFESQQGYKLTFTPFFAYAVVKALKEFPIVNSSAEDDAIIYKNFINLGIAVASPAGLIVPVVRNAGERSFLDLAQSLSDLAIRAREKKLVPDDVTDGTFSITNYGVFGNIIGTPIINQPQVAILGVGAIKKRPMVMANETGEDAVVVRSMVYLTLSFDHRIIDGATGGQFLARVKWHLENFEMEVLKQWE